MQGLPKSYRTMEDFEREEIRPSFRIGFSIDDLEESTFEAEHQFGAEQQNEFELDSYESSDDEDDEDEDEKEKGAEGDPDELDLDEDEETEEEEDWDE